jgi:AraC-like DNA-binding protein
MQQYLERLSCDWSSDSVRIINTPGNVARQNWLYVQETGYFKTRPPYFTERAGLVSFLIIFTLSGKGQLYYKGNKYMLEKDSCVWIDCRERHLYEAVDGGWEFLWLHFYGNFAFSYYQEFASDGSPIVNAGEELSDISKEMRQIVEENRHRGIAEELRSANLITDIITKLILSKTVAGGESRGKVPEYVEKCADYIDRHFREEIVLEEMAQFCNVSRYHLSREFGQYIGVSPKEYLIRARINCAKELLRDTDLSVEEVAFSVGVYNVSHFINLFKAREGITPHKFRNQWKERGGFVEKNTGSR